MTTPHLLWLATGSRKTRLQALYSLYSALAFRGKSDATLHIYTEDAGVYEPLAKFIAIHELTADRVRELSGAAALPYRMKLALLSETLRQDSASAAMCVDADTFFIHDYIPLLNRIDARNAVMHIREWHVASAPTGQLRRFRRNMQRLHFGEGLIDLNVYMWNSGVVGLHPSCLHTLDEALAFMDEVWAQYRKPFVEQFAVSAFLQKAKITIHPADEYLFHYWYQKPEYQRAIEERLARWRDLPVESALDELRRDHILLPPPPRKLNLWERMRQRTSGHAIQDVRGLPESRKDREGDEPSD